MSYNRSNEIYEELVNLRQLLKNYDGSNTIGYVTSEMNKQYEETLGEIRKLETELSTIRL